MSDLPLRFDAPVTLVGNGPLAPGALDEARAIAPVLIAADRGAERLAEHRLTPAAIIGDMDSLADRARFEGGATRILHLAEQETTDFEKCLYATEAPFYLGVGFTGRRIDHTLAVFHAMLRHPERSVVLAGEVEAIALARAGRRLRLRLTPGARVSIFPLLPVTGTHSRGLVWPIDGLSMAPGRQIGTSNEAVQPLVELEFDAPGALVMVERAFLRGLVEAVTAA